MDFTEPPASSTQQPVRMLPQPPALSATALQHGADGNLLSILAWAHYVIGGLSALIGMLLLLMPYFITFASKAKEQIWSFQMIGCAMFLMMGAMGILAFLCGHRLEAGERLKFCQRVAVMECIVLPLGGLVAFASIAPGMGLLIPLGLALGLSTLMTLRRPGVRERFRS